MLPENAVVTALGYLYYGIFTGLLAGTLTYMVVEGARHRGRLNTIPARVLVNGIRGKSSITRLIAGALRGGDVVAVAKTTGTAARFIRPDGHETAIPRPHGVVNVIEQVGVVARATTHAPAALVMECMAVDPALQQLNTEQLVRPHITVISNVREDHLEEMGGRTRSLDNVARSLARSMPRGGVCVTAEQERWGILAEEAARRDCRLMYADPAHVTADDMAGFNWITFPENVACALTVAELLGVPRDAALTGMWQAAPDPGVLSVERHEIDGKTIDAVNLFAANDPRSTLMNIALLQRWTPFLGQVSVVIGCRPDRVERNGQMGQLVGEIDPAAVYLIGVPTRSAARHIPGGWQGHLHDMPGDMPGADLLATIIPTLEGEKHTLLLVGNIHGQGEELLDALTPTALAVAA